MERQCGGSSRACNVQTRWTMGCTVPTIILHRRNDLAGAHTRVIQLTMQSAIERFIVVRSASTDDAAVRLQSEPLRLGLADACGAEIILVKPDPSVKLSIDRPSCILFHYVDDAAIELIRNREPDQAEVTIVCLGCDIYSYDPYTDLHDLVDCYIAPTELHRKLLSNQLYKPVYFLPECTDPIAAGPDEFPVKTGKRLLWFGYSESFTKSMSSLLPVIRDAVARGSVDAFELVVDRDTFIRRYGSDLGLTLRDYDNATFMANASSFDYAILSHFALDLTVNSYVKSPNKLVTALLSGLIPICSDTPNYRLVLSQFGLERFLFSSPLQLNRILNGLDPAADSRLVQCAGAVSALRREGSNQAVCERFLDILACHARRDEPPAFASLTPERMHREQPPPPPPPVLRFREHLRDLAPSLGRTVRERIETWTSK